MGQGPLSGVRVLEFAGIGPAPFCGMLLSDLGADVLRIDRKGAAARGDPVTSRGRRSLALDLKAPSAVAAGLRLIERADILIEGFRPGVMERLGLGPDPALSRNPALVYGRMTGWGQGGPLAQTAGHDIDYLAISGALHAIGTAEAPVPPLNLVGDYGGGALYLAFGVLAALLNARQTGQGQVVDCAIADGAASLMAMFYGFRAGGLWSNNRGTNLLDGGAHFYGAYVCADGRHLAVGAIEPQFYSELLERAGLTRAEFEPQMDRRAWPRLKARLAECFRQKSRDEWLTLFEGSDACVAPVLDLDEAPRHPHNRARGTFVDANGLTQPAPAPRFSRTPGAIHGPAPAPGEGGRRATMEWGLSAAEVADLSAAGAFGEPEDS